MTAADAVREWALNLRALLEVHEAKDVRLTLGDGTVLLYRAGRGLTVLSGGRKLEVPESALDEERWAVAT